MSDSTRLAGRVVARPGKAAVAPRRRPATEVARLARVVQTTGACTHVLVRAESEAELLREICRVIVVDGGYRLAWTGLAEHDTDKTVRPAGFFGCEAGYLEKTGSTWADEPRGQGPVGAAIRTRRPAICRDVARDPKFAPWRDDARKRGYGSLAVLPLVAQGEILGALAIYAVEPDAFDDAETRWLNELADDLAYGIAALRMRDEKRRAEAELRERVSELKQAQRVAHVGSWQRDFATNQVVWSDELCRIFGLDAREPPRYDDISRLLPPESWCRLQAAVEQVRGRGATFELELEIIRTDGRRGWVLARGEPWRDAGGKIVGVRGATQDITERKQARDKLQLFRALIDRSKDAIEVVEPASGQFVDVNETACRMLGYTREELLTMTVFDIDREIDHARYEALRRRLRETGSLTVEARHYRKDGSAFPVELSLSPGGPNNEFGVTIVRDITERKKAEEELQFRAVLLSAQQEASIDGILLVDADARILSYNRRFIEIWRLPARLVADRSDEPVLQFVTAQQADPAAFLQRVRYLFEHRQEIGRDELQLADGRIIDRYSAPICGPQGRYHGRVWYFRDITDRRALEGQLLQSQKFDAFGQLAGGVAHDFNNILAAMLLQMNVLQQEPGLSEQVSGGLAELARQAERAVRVTRQLLLFSRRHEMEIRVLDLNVVLEGISRMLGRLIGENIAFELKTAPEPLCVRADAGMVEQVVMNLCVNARDAMPQGGRLTLESRRKTPRASSVRPGPCACLLVTDTGCGMDAATKARIFEPFFTTKPVGKGTGLGLATVYGIVQQHHGCIEVDSAPGQGSCFRVYFPLTDEAVETKAEVPDKVRGGTESILLVEDEEVVRNMTACCLRRAGYRVVEAANGREGLRRWVEHGPGFDLLLTDYLMPEGLTGMQLAEQLRQRQPGLRVIVASGYRPGTDTPAQSQPAAVTLLAKPFEIATLLHAVRQSLDEAPLPPAGAAG